MLTSENFILEIVHSKH